MVALDWELGATWIWKAVSCRTSIPVFEKERRESRSLSGPLRPRCSGSLLDWKATTPNTELNPSGSSE